MRFALLAVLLLGCSDLPAASPRAGGGTEGVFDGHLTVLVVDAANAPVAGAAVSVDGASIGATNADGRVDADLETYDVVAVEAEGFRGEWWLGADAAVLTIPLTSLTPTEIPTARVRATIEGWESLPRSPTAELWAIAGRASDKSLDARENEIHGSSDRLGCVAPRDAVCELEVTVPAGDTMLFAEVVEVDMTAGTFRPIAFALGDALTVAPDELREGTRLAVLPEAALVTIDLTLELPSDPQLDAVVGVPGLGLTDSVLVPIGSGGITQFVFPTPGGALAGASTWAIASASGPNATSRIVMRGDAGVRLEGFAFGADAYLSPPAVGPATVTRPSGYAGVLEVRFGTQLRALVFDDRPSFEATLSVVPQVTAIATEVQPSAGGWCLGDIERSWTRRATATRDF